MPNQLVKLITNDDGAVIDTPYWHLVSPVFQADPSLLCTGEFFGEGQSGCEYEEKTVIKGGVTCPQCLRIIKEIKSVKL